MVRTRMQNFSCEYLVFPSHDFSVYNMLRRARLLTLLGTTAGTSTTLRLVTFNIHAWRDSSHLDNLDRIISQCKELDADVLCLNEVLHPFTAPALDDPYWDAVRERRGTGYEPPEGSVPVDESSSYLARLSEALSMPHVAFGSASRSGFFGKYNFGNAVLSRHALSGVRHKLLDLQPGDLTLGGQQRTEADLEPRSATVARVRLPGGQSLGVCVTHLDHKSEELRERQISEAAGVAREAFEGGLHVLCGDLNSFDKDDMSSATWDTACDFYRSRGWPPPPARSLVCGAMARLGYIDAYRAWQQRQPLQPTTAEQTHPPLTCWSHKPLYRLDYVFASKPAEDELMELVVRSHRTLATDVSDHHAVVVELELVPKTDA